MSKNYPAVFLGLVTLFSFLYLGQSVVALTLTPSENLSIGAIVGGLPIVDTGGSRGGGIAQSGIRFSGFAYPEATVTVQNVLNALTSVTADTTGAFSVVVSQNGTQFYTLFATDTDGRRSTLINFPATLYSGRLTDITGIRFAPTIVTDKLAIKKGSYLTVSGAAVPAIPLELIIEGAENALFTLSANADGHYSITVPITLSPGEYTLKIGYTGDSRVSRVIRLVVGTSDIYQAEATNNIPGDCNVDQRVTIVDFSVLAYWYGKKNPPACVDLNKDGVITLVDFSIMAFYWNG